MLPPAQRTPKPVLRKVLGWVLIAPLLLSFLRLPFPLGLVLVLASITASVYGARFAQLHASRRVTVFAVIITLFNIASFLSLVRHRYSRRCTGSRGFTGIRITPIGFTGTPLSRSRIRPQET